MIQWIFSNCSNNMISFIFVSGLGKVTLETKYNPHNNVLVVRKPSVNMGEEWTIELKN